MTAAVKGLTMSIFFSLSSLALRQAVDGACTALGVKDGGEAVVGFLTERFTDHSQRLTKRREVRRMLARRSQELLDRYRRGGPVPEGCPLRKALAGDGPGTLIE